MGNLSSKTNTKQKATKLPEEALVTLENGQTVDLYELIPVFLRLQCTKFLTKEQNDFVFSDKGAQIIKAAVEAIQSLDDGQVLSPPNTTRVSGTAFPGNTANSSDDGNTQPPSPKSPTCPTMLLNVFKDNNNLRDGPLKDLIGVILSYNNAIQDYTTRVGMPERQTYMVLFNTVFYQLANLNQKKTRFQVSRGFITWFRKEFDDFLDPIDRETLADHMDRLDCQENSRPYKKQKTKSS